MPPGSSRPLGSPYATAALRRIATARMRTELAWFAELSADEQSWVGLVAQAGIDGFVEWYRSGQRSEPRATPLAGELFDAAPRALTGVITLQQTVDLIRLGLEVVETNVEGLFPAEPESDVHAGVLRYGREVAFATAEVYARAAEVRGAWDARLEALVVDSVVRAEADEGLSSRASALGWGGRGGVAVVVGDAPHRRADTDLFAEVRQLAHAGGMDALCAIQGSRLVVILGGVTDEIASARAVADVFDPGPVVVGPIRPDLVAAPASARAALAAQRAAAGWPRAPRPVGSTDLLPERALAGDGHARRHLVEEVYRPLTDGKETLVETLSTWFERGGVLEATARELFVHPNTVRYRMRQVAEVTGYSPGQPRHAFTLQVALVLGRQSETRTRRAR